MTDVLLSISQRLIKWDSDFPPNCWNGYAGLKELDAIIADAKVAVSRADTGKADGVAVKPLEWAKHGESYRAMLPMLGKLWVEPDIDAKFVVNYSVPGFSNSFIDAEFETVDEAKAAAQAEYEARILAALASPAPEAQREDTAPVQAPAPHDAVTDEMVRGAFSIRLSSVDLPACECLHESDVREIINAALSPSPLTKEPATNPVEKGGEK